MYTHGEQILELMWRIDSHQTLYWRLTGCSCYPQNPGRYLISDRVIEIKILQVLHDIPGIKCQIDGAQICSEQQENVKTTICHKIKGSQ